MVKEGETFEAAGGPEGAAEVEGSGIGVNNNNYTRAMGQNVGNFLTDRPSSRVLAPPGGGSQICFGSDPEPAVAKVQAAAAVEAAPVPPENSLLSPDNSGNGVTNNYSRPIGQNVSPPHAEEGWRGWKCTGDSVPNIGAPFLPGCCRSATSSPTAPPPACSHPPAAAARLRLAERP